MPKPKLKKTSALDWVFESLQAHPDFFQKKMFGCEAAYFKGKLSLVLASGEEPWNGILVCTSREDHAALIKDFPVLASHQILGKWLYLSQKHSDFEDVSLKLVDLVKKEDPRLGVEPKPKRKTKRSPSR